MKVLFDILKNPFAIATAVVHWLVFFYCLAFEETDFFSNSISFHRYAPVFEWLILLNVIPLLLVELAVAIFNLLIGMNLISNIIVSTFALLLVNFQWLLVGYCLSKLFNLFNPKEINFSIK